MRRVVETGPAGGGAIVMELDRDLRHLHASSAALAMVGLPAEALVGRTYAEAGLPPEVVGPLERELRATVTSGRERQIELEMPTSDGLLWLHLRLVPTGPDPLAPDSVVITATDVTARKHAELRQSAGSAAFRALVEDSPDPIALIDEDLRIVFVNDALVRASGRAATALLGGGVADVGLWGEVVPRLEAAIRSAAATGERTAIDFRSSGPTGARWFSARLLPEPAGDGTDSRGGRVILTCTDVTDRVNRETEQAALRRVATVVAREADLSEIARVVAEEVALLLNANGSAVYRFDSQDAATCVAAHPPTEPEAGRNSPVLLTGATATGRTARTGEASRVDDYRRAPDDPSVREVLRAGLRSGIASPLWTRGRLWGAVAAGSPDANGFGPGEERRLAAFAELAAIAVANAETREELDRLAATDPLTGLANRRALTARLEGEVDRARRHGHALSLAILDLDHFKVVNDTLGHQAGDAVLAAVGRSLAATCRSGELVARMGGEEFAWILPGLSAPQSVVAIERARDAIAQISVADVSGITCSAGVCDISLAVDVVELLQLADRALYVAKEAGRNRVELAG